MNPLFFGTSDRPLFGVYHPPRTRDGRAHAVVLCYPAGQEYMRAHRAFRQLAILLSRAGFPVLRFDYYSTGDSGGDADAGSLDGWVGDIGTAIDEVRDTAAVREVSLVGLRLGAWLAASVQARRTDVRSVVLWDPVSQGADYIVDLLRTTELTPDEQTAALADSRGTTGINGFPWTPTLKSEVAAIRTDTYVSPAHGAVSLLVSDERTDHAALRDHYAGQLNGRFSYRCIPGPGDWAFIDAYGSALLPQDIIQGIVNHIVQENAS
jgi:uncharacterized protein